MLANMGEVKGEEGEGRRCYAVMEDSGDTKMKSGTQIHLYDVYPKNLSTVKAKEKYLSHDLK